MAAGDLIQIPIKAADGTTKQVQFEEQADGSLAPVHVARGEDGAALATQATLASLLAKVSGDQATQTTLADALAAIQAQAKGTAADPTTAVLSGRNAELIAAAHTSIAIRDTGWHDSAVIDVSGYRDLLIMAYETLDQNADLFVLADPFAQGTLRELTATGGGQAVTLVGGAGRVQVVSAAELPALKASLTELAIRLTCSTAPTSGVVSVQVYGSPA